MEEIIDLKSDKSKITDTQKQSFYKNIRGFYAKLLQDRSSNIRLLVSETLQKKLKELASCELYQDLEPIVRRELQAELEQDVKKSYSKLLWNFF